MKTLHCVLKHDILSSVWYWLKAGRQEIVLTSLKIVDLKHQHKHFYSSETHGLMFEGCSFVCYVWFDSLRPINKLSVIKGRVFLDWTSTKLGLMFLLKDTTQWRQWGSNPAALRSRVKRSTTEPLRSLRGLFLIQGYEADFLWKVSLKFLS